MIPERPGWRIALGAAAAALVLLAIHGLLAGGPARAVAPAATSPAASGPRDPEVLDSLRSPGVWLLYLAGRAGDLPAAAAPVVLVEPGGGLRLLRSPPLARGPRQEPWLAAGVVLPAADLAELRPVDRVALLDVLGALAGPRSLLPDQLVTRGVGARPGEAGALLRWLR